MIEELVKYDQELFMFLNGLGTPSWDFFWMTYTTKLNWIPFYAILLYLMHKRLGSKPFLLTILVVAIMILFTDQITNLFKYGVQRLRPCHTPGLQDAMRIVRKGCGGQYGFFSGHASNSMAVAVFVGLMLKKRFKYLIFILIGWSFLMSYSRIYVGVHYPLDVLCGTIFGAISAVMFYFLNRYVLKALLNYKI